jgi:6-phospho-beta-galactosidase
MLDAFPDLSWMAREGSPLPNGFLWGVANAGFQVEGGFNGRGEPQNDWADQPR